jgi:hypothetical protein
MSIFSGGKDMRNAINQSGDIYQQEMQKIQDLYQQRYGEGRGDITKYFGQALGYQQPYMEAGQQGLDEYMRTMGLGQGGAMGQQGAVDRFHTTTGYQFAVNQGMLNARRGAAAAGLSGSGAEQKALMQQAQGMADQEFSGYQNRLQGLAGMGQQAATTSSGLAAQEGGSLANLGLSYTGGQAGVLSQMAQAQAEQRMAAAEAAMKNRSSMFGTIGSIFGSGMKLAAGGMLGGGNYTIPNYVSR